MQYTFGIRSMRKMIEKVETNMAYRWFLGYGFHDKVPPTPRSGKIISDALKIQNLFEQIFNRILMTATNKKLISAEHVFVDSTHVKASANNRKFEKKIVRKETRAYQGRLQEEIIPDRENHGNYKLPI
ncbi:transposase [Peribacillus frigoritolerans]|uniref:transposase n=1 Tax=Peribacillus castrilensis TaxID=2897690 RepID=UPI003D286B7F